MLIFDCFQSCFQSVSVPIPDYMFLATVCFYHRNNHHFCKNTFEQLTICIGEHLTCAIYMYRGLPVFSFSLKCPLWPTDFPLKCPVPSGPLPSLFKLCPWGQKWAHPWGHMFYIGLYRENMKKSSRLKQQGLKPWYLVCSITLWTSTKFVQIMPLGLKGPLPVCHMFYISLYRENMNNCWHFNIYEQDKFCAQLSWVWVKFYNLKAWLFAFCIVACESVCGLCSSFFSSWCQRWLCIFLFIFTC